MKETQRKEHFEKIEKRMKDRSDKDRQDGREFI